MNRDIGKQDVTWINLGVKIKYVPTVILTRYYWLKRHEEKTKKAGTRYYIELFDYSVILRTRCSSHMTLGNSMAYNGTTPTSLEKFGARH